MADDPKPPLSEELRNEVRDIAEWHDEPRIKHQHEDWAERAAALETANSVLRIEHDDFQALLDASEQRAAALEAELEQAQTAFADIDAANEQLTDKLRAAKAREQALLDSGNAYRNQVDMLRGKYAVLEAERDKLAARVAVLEGDENDTHYKATHRLGWGRDE